MSSMIQLNLIQGSEAWLDSRLKQFNASEAPVIMGSHPNMTRDELLEIKATCNPKEYSRFVEEKIFSKGHETEALARPILEAAIGEDLYPVSGKNGKYQASYDGLTLMQDTGFEHKQHNAELALLVQAGKVPAYIAWQLEHQLLVCPDLEKIILVVSDGTEANWAQMEYRAVPGRREQLIAGWEQFEKDLEEFKPVVKTVEAVGVRPDSLPALFVDVAGALTTSSNLDAFRAGAEQLIGSIKTELVTDQDFADAEAAIKWLDDTEKNIDIVIKQALSKTGPLDALIRTLEDVQKNLARATRLKLNKQVEAQKVNRRNQIVAQAEAGFGNFLDTVNNEFKPARVFIGEVRPDFYTAIKGKRSFDMMVSACNDLIAKSKIEVNEIASKVRTNLAKLAEHKDHDFLFANKQQLAFMEPDHLELTISSKINEYKQQQAQQESARIQRHKNAIAGIDAAGEFGDDVPLRALEQTRDRIADMDTSRLEEFALQGDQAKAATLAKLADRIKQLHQQAEDARKAEVQQAAPAAAVRSEPPASYVATSTVPDTDDTTIHTAAIDMRVDLLASVEEALDGWAMSAKLRTLLVSVREYLEQ